MRNLTSESWPIKLKQIATTISSVIAKYLCIKYPVNGTIVSEMNNVTKLKSRQAKSKAKMPFYKQKWFKWTLGSIAAILILVALIFRLSPAPGALIIRSVFNNNGAKTLEAMQKHTPTTPITVVENQNYRANDKDAQLDVYYREGTTSPQPTILWTHGGAWLSGDKKDDAPYFKLLAAAGFTVIGINYSLAPGHQYPTPVHQLNDAYSYIQTHASKFHVDTTKFFLAGDSAGAQLSSQMAAIISNPTYAKELKITPTLHTEQLKGVILFCGIYMMDGLTQPDTTLPKIVGWGDDISVWAYSGTKDFTDPRIKEMSAYYNVAKNYPATFISGGNSDPLTEAQSKPFADLLELLGTDVTRLFYADAYSPKLPHEYQFNLDTDAGQKALQQTIQFVKQKSLIQ
jgi:acetyl esterase